MKFNVLQAIAKMLTFASNITNPIIINPLEQMYLTNHQCINVIVFFFPFKILLEFLKLATIAMVHVLGFVEDE
jgi:hypothetical protein